MLLFLAEWQLRHNHRKNPDMLEDHIIGRILRLDPSSRTASAQLARTAPLEFLISERGAMRKEVEEFLKCVAKQQPQLLDANADEQGFNLNPA